MTDRERMIEVIENALQGYSTHDDMPFDEVLEGITPEIADRLIEAGFGRVEKGESIVDRLTRNMNEENRE